MPVKNNSTKIKPRPKPQNPQRKRAPLGTVQQRTNASLRGITEGTMVKMRAPKSRLPMYINCIIDPENAPACRLPDDYTSPTSAIKLIDEYTIASDSQGNVVFGVYPGVFGARIGYAISYATITTGATGVATSTNHPDFASLTTNFNNGRMICMAIVVNYIAPPLTASGRLISVTGQESNVVASDNISIATVMDDGESGPAQNGRRVVVRARQAPRFAPVATDYGVPTMPYTYFLGTGLPANLTVFSVRVVRHFEGIPLKTSVMRGSAAPGFADTNVLTMASNMGDIGTVSDADSGSKNTAVEMATTAAHAAWDLLTPYASSAARTAGTAAASYAADILTGMMI